MFSRNQGLKIGLLALALALLASPAQAQCGWWGWWKQPPTAAVEDTYFEEIDATGGRLQSYLISRGRLAGSWVELFDPAVLAGDIVDQTLTLDTVTLFGPDGVEADVVFNPAQLRKSFFGSSFSTTGEVLVYEPGLPDPVQTIRVRITGQVTLSGDAYFLTARVSGFDYVWPSFGARPTLFYSFFSLNLSGNALIGALPPDPAP